MKAMNINPEQFSQLLAGDKPVLVDFWAPWCPYCVKITEAYDAIAAEYGEQIEVVKVNIDDYEPLSDEQGVDVIPTLILYQNGKAVDSIIAPESKAAIERFLGKTLPAKKRTQDTRVHDMLIVGGGPGGYTAALYAARAGLDAVVLEKLSAGGQMALTEQIDNYPGFANGISGHDLAADMKKQAERFGAQTVNAQVTRMDLSANPKVIETSEGAFLGKTVVIATGANPRKLGVPEEDALVGRGVAYCASCDGMFFKDKDVVVIGGGDSAVTEALQLSRIARSVTIIHRRDTLRATKVYHDQLMKIENVHFAWDSVVEKIAHDDKVTGVHLRNVKTGEEHLLPCEGVFVAIGREPVNALFRDQLTLEGGYIQAGESTETSIPGVFAVGDIRTKALRQVVTAVADGAMAVHAAEGYLAEQN